MIIKIILCYMLGLFSSVLLGLLFIPTVKKLKINQNVSRMVNERHLQKDKTPTMGGIIFIVPTIIIFALLVLLKKIEFSLTSLIYIFSIIGYCIIGFIDDFLKIKYKNNKGLSILTKFILELFIAVIIYILFLYNIGDTTVKIGSLVIDLKILYGLYLLFLYSATSNAVNITDGLDGLCAGCVIISILSFSFIAIDKLYFNDVALIFVLMGALSGYLYFNFYPAKIFMGDLGSLALGGMIASLSIVLKEELLIIPFGMIYIIETLSSMVQIISIKHFHKRIFLKSPLHHHFEEKGYRETEIIKLFYLIQVIFGIIGLVLYFYL